jgi:hypothetical protein
MSISCSWAEHGQQLCDEILEFVKTWHAHHPANDWDKHKEVEVSE